MPETPNPTLPNLPVSSPKKPFSMMLVAAVVVVLGLGGGGFWFMTHRATAVKAQAKSPALSRPAPPVATMALQTFLVNLADANHDTFLKIGITLGVSKPVSGGEDKPSPLTPEIRDTILQVLTQSQSGDLLTDGGKNKLKAELLAALQKRVPQLGVEDVYFTDFLIQQ